MTTARFTLRQLQMPGKIIFLEGERRVIPVPIEAGFSQADNFWAVSPSQRDRVPVGRGRLSDVIGLNADRGAEQRMAGGEIDACSAGGACGGDGDNVNEIGSPRSLQHRGQIRLELLVVKMGVGVDERHGLAVFFGFPSGPC